MGLLEHNHITSLGISVFLSHLWTNKEWLFEKEKAGFIINEQEALIIHSLIHIFNIFIELLATCSAFCRLEIDQ